MKRLIIAIGVLMLLPALAAAQDQEEQFPPEVRPICDILGTGGFDSAGCVRVDDDTVELQCRALPDSAAQERVSYYMGEGAGLFGSGNYQRALLSYSCVVEQIDPSFGGAHIRRALAFTARRDYRPALADYTTAIGIDANQPSVYNNRAIVYTAIGEYELAVADLDSALSIDTNYLPAYHNRAVVNGILGNYETAIEDLNTSIELSDIQSVVDELRDPDRPGDAPRPEYDLDHARAYGILGIIRSAQALEEYADYLLLLGGSADQRIQSAAGALESRFSFELQLQDGTWLLVADFDQF